VEAFICHNPDCPHRKDHKTGRQFVLATSRPFKEEIWKRLQGLYEDLILDGDKACSVAKKYHVSEAEVSALRAEVTAAIEDQRGLDQLVSAPQPDTAIAIDETFLKLEGKTLFVIIATGFTTHKTLGVRVSATRNEGDMRAVFDEAQQNVENEIEVVISDAHAATQKMAKNLNRPITHVIHRHKKPYKKVVIRHIAYEGNTRVITDVGVKAGVFAHRGTREYRHLTRTEPVQVPPKRKRGRPKGVKNGQGKKKAKGTGERGRRGLFGVFSRGEKGYMKVDPRRALLHLAERCPSAVVAALGVTFNLFGGMSIQNNLAENINSVIRALWRMRGPRVPETFEKRLRAVLIVRNDPAVIKSLHIARHVRGTIFLNNVRVAECAQLAVSGWILGNQLEIKVGGN
jgi:hypothetical protein